MKYINLILTICLTISMVSCNDDDNFNENTDLMGTWKITKVYNHNETKEITIGECLDELIFKSNNTGYMNAQISNNSNCITKKLSFQWGKESNLLKIMGDQIDDATFNVLSLDKKSMKLKLLVANNETLKEEHQRVVILNK